MALEVAPVRGGRDLAAFIAFPYALHRGDPLWTPPLRRDVRALLSPAKNPFFGTPRPSTSSPSATAEVVGRITAIDNRAHNEFHGDRVGFFGFFESDGRPGGRAPPSFDAAAGWLPGRGLDVLRGPASFSTNDEAGLLVDGFDTPAASDDAAQPAATTRRWSKAPGFRKAKDLLVYQRTVRPAAGAPARPRRSAAQERYGDHGPAARHGALRRRRWTGVKRLYNAAWERNWGFVPMTDAEIDFLARAAPAGGGAGAGRSSPSTTASPSASRWRCPTSTWPCARTPRGGCSPAS